MRARRLIKGDVVPLFYMIDVHILTKGVSFAKTALETLRRAAVANMNVQVRLCFFFFNLGMHNRDPVLIERAPYSAIFFSTCDRKEAFGQQTPGTQ